MTTSTLSSFQSAAVAEIPILASSSAQPTSRVALQPLAERSQTLACQVFQSPSAQFSPSSDGIISPSRLPVSARNLSDVFGSAHQPRPNLANILQSPANPPVAHLAPLPGFTSADQFDLPLPPFTAAGGIYSPPSSPVPPSLLSSAEESPQRNRPHEASADDDLPLSNLPGSTTSALFLSPGAFLSPSTQPALTVSHAHLFHDPSLCILPSTETAPSVLSTTAAPAPFRSPETQNNLFFNPSLSNRVISPPSGRAAAEFQSPIAAAPVSTDFSLFSFSFPIATQPQQDGSALAANQFSTNQAVPLSARAPAQSTAAATAAAFPWGASSLSENLQLPLGPAFPELPQTTFVQGAQSPFSPQSMNRFEMMGREEAEWDNQTNGSSTTESAVAALGATAATASAQAAALAEAQPKRKTPSSQVEEVQTRPKKTKKKKK